MRKIFKVAIGVTAVTIAAASTAIVGTSIYLSKTHQTTDDLKKKAKKAKDKVFKEIDVLCDEACEKVENAKELIQEKTNEIKDFVEHELEDSDESDDEEFLEEDSK